MTVIVTMKITNSTRNSSQSMGGTS